MKKYDKYKDSGIEWIGKVPLHWAVSKLNRNVEKLTNGYVGPIREMMQHSGVPYIQGIHIKKNGIEFTPDGPYFVSEEWSNNHQKSILKENDLLFVQTGEIGKVGIVSKLYEGANCHALIIVRPKKEIFVSKYLYYYFVSNGGHYILNKIRTGEILHHINGSKLKAVEVVSPSLKEQTAIANYLDKKTAQIDQLIEDKKRLVELYKEEKTAIINQAVTKGVNPNVELKNSGIEWLGKIPAHWEVKKLRFLCKLTTGDKDTENREDDAKYPFFVRSQTIERISTYSFDGEAILTAGDGVGVCKVWHYVNGKFDFHQRVYMMYEFQEVSGELLFQFLKQNFIHEVLKKSAKSTVDSLRRPMFLDFPVAFPIDRAEQVEIIQHLETESTRLNTKIQNAEKYVELLIKYRTALISEVVTGKIKVID